MNPEIKFVHTNIIAKDWRKLARFYMDVFGCTPVYPERDLSGEWIEKLTNIAGVTIQGIHLRLPGYGEAGPTLEIFGYNTMTERNSPRINDRGFSHIAFHVTEVNEVLNRLIAAGGSKYGELVEKEMAEIGKLTVIYARDPEGNIIEIQKWEGKS